MHRGAIAEINLSAIAHNLRAIRKIVRNRPVIAVVKADAYGHGALQVSQKLIEEGISSLAVAYTGEAIELRNAGISVPILVLFDNQNIEDFFDFDLTPVLYDERTAANLSKEAVKRGKRKKVHVKVDTGMGRLGLIGGSEIAALSRICVMPGIELEGVLSHFAEADLSDRSYALLQLKRFNDIKHEISKKLKRKICAHIANSAAILALEEAHLDAVRPGLMLCGYSPLINNSSTPRFPKASSQKVILEQLIPAMMVRTRILCIRDLPAGTPISYGRTFITKRPSKIGVLPIGYADGYSRLFSNNSDVLVRGKRARVVGRVCMDLTMVDLTDIRDVREEDEVVILGKQGNESITADELASKTQTISYEILTSLGNRSRRAYVETH
ncbi:MAG: alanine racemase [Nitrospirota bacterium]